MGQYKEKLLLKVIFVILITAEFVCCANLNKIFNVKVFFEPNIIPTTVLSCQDAKLKSLISNGKTMMEVPDYPDPFHVSCKDDPEGGPAWTVIQRRQNGHVDFNRDWIDYVTGFGDVGDEHFMGLSKLHALTKSQPHELWIELESFNGNRTHAYYDAFAVGDKDSHYAITNLGTYTGTAGDSMSKHKGQKFTTKDVDHDNWQKGNCAKQYKGGWWFNACLDSNLNGQYHGNGLTPTTKWAGVYWYDFTDWDLSYSLKYTHMAIRPKATTIRRVYLDEDDLENTKYLLL